MHEPKPDMGQPPTPSEIIRRSNEQYLVCARDSELSNNIKLDPYKLFESAMAIVALTEQTGYSQRARATLTKELRTDALPILHQSLQHAIDRAGNGNATVADLRLLLDQFAPTPVRPLLRAQGQRSQAINALQHYAYSKYQMPSNRAWHIMCETALFEATSTERVDVWSKTLVADSARLAHRSRRLQAVVDGTGKGSQTARLFVAQNGRAFGRAEALLDWHTRVQYSVRSGLGRRALGPQG